MMNRYNMDNSQKFLQKIYNIYGDKYDYSKIVYSGSRIAVILKCNKCHHEFRSRPSVIITSGFSGCPNCDKIIRYKLFIDRSNVVHSDKYDYSLIDYKNHSTKVSIVCPIHGIFEQTPNNHVAGNGCPECSLDEFRIIKTTNEEFIEKANVKHNNKYDYSKCNYIGSKKNIIVTCKTHGDFIIKADKHISGTGCDKCTDEELELYYKSLRKSNNDFIKKANIKHNNKFDYSKCDYVNAKNNISIICPIHGEFRQKPSSHLSSKHGCPKCANECGSVILSHDINYFTSLSKKMHNNRYDYSISEYNGIKNNIVIICPIHGKFEQRAENHLNGIGCKECSKFVSSGQQHVVDYIKSVDNNIKIIDNYKNQEDTGEYEVDIWLPDYRIGIEYHGSYWHSSNDSSSDKRMYKLHFNKANQAIDRNFKLLQIYDFEYGEIWKSMISNAINRSSKIGARKLNIKEVSSKEERQFCQNNHLQGYMSSTTCYGLYDDTSLLCLMSFIKKKQYWEIQRFVNLVGKSVIGGASRLFKHFVNNHRPEITRTFADRRYSTGNLYKNLGFRQLEIVRPNYKYVNSTATKIYSRQKCQKHKLHELLGDVFDPNISEAENMFKAGYRRLWDAGNLKFELKHDVHTRPG